MPAMFFLWSLTDLFIYLFIFLKTEKKLNRFGQKAFSVIEQYK